MGSLRCDLPPASDEKSLMMPFRPPMNVDLDLSTLVPPTLVRQTAQDFHVESYADDCVFDEPTTTTPLAQGRSNASLP